MILDVHVAFLLASLSVMFGLTYTIGKFLDHKIEQAKQKRLAKPEQASLEVISA